MADSMSFCYRLEEQKQIRAEIEAENKELRSLNVQLQQQLLKTLNSSSAAKCSGEDNPPPPPPIFPDI